MRARLIALLGVLLLPATFLAGDYVPIYVNVGGSPLIASWAPGSTILYRENVSQPNLEPGSAVTPAVNAALATVGAASGLTFTPGSSTPITGTLLDGVNVISFANTATNQALLNGALAITTVYFNSPNFGIFEFDTIGSATAPFSTLGTPGWFDVEALMVHEGLHAIGFDHSPQASATIWPTLWQGAIGSRTLDVDDLAGIHFVYNANPQAGAVGGTLQRAGSIPVAGGHVFLEDVITGRVAPGTVTFQNGTFTIQQVPPGLYRLYAEPLDGPFTPMDLYAQYWATVSFDLTFRSTAYFGGSPTPKVLVVRPGQLVNVGAFVVSGPPPIRNVDQVFFNSTPTPTPPITVSTVEQSAPYTGYMGIFGAGVDVIPDSAFSIPGPFHQITGPSTWSSNQGTFSDKIFPISVSPQAPPGGYFLQVNDPITGELVMFPGCLEILGPTAPTAWTAPYGIATGGSAGPLTLGANGLPTIGNGGFALTLGNTAAGETAWFVLSALPDYDTTVTPFFIGVDLNSLVFPLLSLGVPTSGGSFTLPFGIPNLPTLAGVEVYTQVIASDGASAFGIALSNALAIHVE